MGTVEDQQILDHTLATLTQLSRSLHTHLEGKEELSSEFPIKDHYLRRMKNNLTLQEQLLLLEEKRSYRKGLQYLSMYHL